MNLADLVTMIDESEDDPERRDHLRAQVVVIQATSVGPNVDLLVRETGYPKAFIAAIAANMREAELWLNDKVDDTEFDYTGDEDCLGLAIFSHALVALGEVKRHKTLEGAVYTDAATGEIVGEWKAAARFS